MNVPRRPMGSTGLYLPVIGFGCGGNAGLMVGDHPDLHRDMVRYALASGIDYFDTAPDYGAGSSEIHLGRVLAELDAAVIVNTKVEIRAANLDDIAGHVLRSLDESLARLGRDHVDIVQIHNGPSAERPDLEGADYKTLWLEDYLRPGGVLDGVERVLASGRARHAGFICRGNDRASVERLLGTRMFSLINVPYTLLNASAGFANGTRDLGAPDYGEVIARAAENGVGVAVFSPLAGGLLTDAVLDGGQPHPLARAKDLAKIDASPGKRRALALRSLAARHDMGITEMAYRFVLSHPGVTTLLAGFSDAAHIDAARSAALRGPLEAPLLEEIASLL